MPMPDRPLPPQVQAAVSAGRLVEAIKLLREATGLGLKEAKDLIDAHAQGRALEAPASQAATGLPPQVMQALLAGHKIEAIRLLREQTGLGLKEAKEAVEAAQPPGQLAPGEVPKGPRFTWVAVAGLAALAAYYFFLRR